MTIPSQNFYVKYFDGFIKHYCSTLKSGVSLNMKSLKITKEDFYPPPRSLVLTKIDLFTIPKMDGAGGCGKSTHKQIYWSHAFLYTQSLGFQYLITTQDFTHQSHSGSPSLAQ